MNFKEEDFILKDLGEDSPFKTVEGKGDFEFKDLESEFQDLGADEGTWHENDDELLEFLSEGIKKSDKYQEHYKKSPKKEPFYEEYLRNLITNGYAYYSDTYCPTPETYVKLWKQTNAVSSTTLLPNDIFIRDSDRSVFFTGTYYQTGAQAYCFWLRMDYLGNYVNGAMLTLAWASNVYCNALTLTMDNHVVTTGQLNNGKSCTLLVYSDDTFQNQVVKIWSQSTTLAGSGYSMVGYDVAVSNDGSIFITGDQNGWTNSNWDCYVLKVDYQLNLIYAKGIGTNLYDTCRQIQVTRNQDYIYLGGYQQYNGAQNQIFFLKLDGYAQTVYYSQYIQPKPSLVNGLAQSLTIRRAILLNPRDSFGTYPGTSAGNSDSNNNLYFCGQYTTSVNSPASGNFNYNLVVFGKLDSTLTLNYMYSYGHPYVYDEYSKLVTSSNDIGDCDVTNDGRFMVLTFSTSSTKKNSNTLYDPGVRTYSVNYAYPYSGGCCVGGGGCNQFVCGTYYSPTSYADLFTLSSGYKNTMAANCRSDFETIMQAYLQEYSQYDYSWATCNFYQYDLASLDCSVNFCFTGGCGCGDYWACCNTYYCAVSTYEANFNAMDVMFYRYYQLWGNTNMGNGQFMEDFYQNNLCSPTSDYGLFEQYIFCDQNTGTFPVATASTYPPTIGWDNFYFLFEQDCQPTGTVLSDFFIIKIDLQLIQDATNFPRQPTNAVYFGQPEGHESPKVIAVDEYGFIIVAGTTDSPNFGMCCSNFGMLYVKTHWDLNYETDHAPETNSGGIYYLGGALNLNYLGRRFVTPKKFQNQEIYFGSTQNAQTLTDQNIGGGYNPGAVTLTFLINLMPSSCSVGGGNTYIYCNPLVQGNVIYVVDGMYSNWIPYAINENTNTLNIGYNYYNYPASIFNGVHSQSNYGIGLSTITQPYDYYLTKGDYFSGNLNTYCLNIESSQRYYDHRVYTYTKYQAVNAGKYYFSSLTITNQTNLILTQSSAPHAYGTPTETEGVYYWDEYKVGVQTVVNMCSNNPSGVVPSPTPPYIQCFKPDYYKFVDDTSYQSLKRFNFAVRLKFIVNDNSIDPPEVIKDIPEQTVTAGLGLSYRTQLQFPVSTYFSPKCTYMYAKQIAYTSGDPITATTQLPYWIVFFEYNQTFIIEPPYQSGAVNPTINLELVCCNNIDECVSNTFSITVTNTIPDTVTLDKSSWIIQYDVNNQAGNYFTWTMLSSVFTDSLNTYNFQTNDIYSHQPQSHNVLLTYPNQYWGGSTTFDSIDYVGMIYGSPNALSSFGSNTITLRYFDQFSVNAYQTLSLTVYINKQCTISTTGTDYVFATIDPELAADNKNLFTYNFPWLRDKNNALVNLDTSTWFTSNNGLALTYSLTNGDGTPRQSWIGYNTVTGFMRSNLLEPVPSGYLELKFTATDVYGGSCSVYKSILVDSPPDVYSQFYLIECSVKVECTATFAEKFFDPNGDFLTYSMPNANDLATLNKNGLDFSTATCIVTGYPIVVTTISFLQITATDPYGLSATLYFTIQVRDTKPYVRGYNNKIPDYTITEGSLYYFNLPNTIVYDPVSGSALNLYLTDLIHKPLPKWISFNPMTYSLSGRAPSPSPQSQKVLVTFMNPITQDSTDMVFTIYVVPNNNPKVRIQYFNEDYVIDQYTRFQTTLSLLLFSDYEVDLFAGVTCTGSNGQGMPSWLTYNKYNRSVYGNATQAGHFVVDCIFTDDSGAKAYSNFGITVLPYNKVEMTMRPHYFFFIWTILGLAIYFSYTWIFAFSLYTHSNFAEREAEKKVALSAMKRFKEYEETEIHFVMPDFADPIESDPAITKDTDFLGLDKLKKWKRHEQRKREREKQDKKELNRTQPN